MGAPPRRRKAAEGRPEEVAARVSEGEKLQLLLVLTDADLVRLIDACIYDGGIAIPPSETRRPRLVLRPLRYHDTGSNISCLGIQNRPDAPLTSLSGAIWKAYSEE